jgi:hypothetical protein
VRDFEEGISEASYSRSGVVFVEIVAGRSASAIVVSIEVSVAILLKPGKSTGLAKPR